MSCLSLYAQEDIHGRARHLVDLCEEHILDGQDKKVLFSDFLKTTTIETAIPEFESKIESTISDDGRLKFFEDVMSGGRMRNVEIVAMQYKSEDGKTMMLDFPVDDSEVVGTTFSITNIRDGVYVVESGLRIQMGQWSYLLTLLKVVDKCVVYTDHLISDINHHNFTHEEFDAQDIEMLADKTIVVPTSWSGNSSRWDGKYQKYVIRGEEFVKEECPYSVGLHESISDFEAMELGFATSGFLVRIDKMHDGQYRYSSWKRGQRQTEKPNIVLYGGRKEPGVFVFSNGDYTYKVSAKECNLHEYDDHYEDPVLEVLKSGERILRQEWKF